MQELALGWASDPETLRILTSHAQTDENGTVREAVVLKLARGWASNPMTPRILKSCVESDGYWAVRQTAVQELARGWASDPETLRILKSRIESDENGSVRGAAMRNRTTTATCVKRQRRRSRDFAERIWFRQLTFPKNRAENVCKTIDLYRET
jgi:hypothetical protein